MVILLALSIPMNINYKELAQILRGEHWGQILFMIHLNLNGCSMPRKRDDINAMTQKTRLSPGLLNMFNHN